MSNRFARILIVAVIIAAACVYLFGNGSVALWDRDEPRYAQTSRQMLDSGDWVVPHYLDMIRTAKPAAIYWCQAAAMSGFGVNSFSARFPSSASIILLLIVLAIVLWKKVDPMRAAWTVFVLATAALTIASAKMCITDALLLLWVTISQICLYAAWRGRASWPVVIVWAVAVGLAGLTKGPVVLGMQITTLIALGAIWAGKQIWEHYFKRPESRGFDVSAPSPGTPGEGRGEGDFEGQTTIDIPNHPNPLPEYRERGPEKNGAGRRKNRRLAPHRHGRRPPLDPDGQPPRRDGRHEQPVRQLHRHAGEARSLGPHDDPAGTAQRPAGVLLPGGLGDVFSVEPSSAAGGRVGVRSPGRSAIAVRAGRGDRAVDHARVFPHELPFYFLPAFPPLAFLVGDAIVRTIKGELADLRGKLFVTVVGAWSVLVIVLSLGPWIMIKVYSPIAIIIVLNLLAIGFAAFVWTSFLRGRVLPGLIGMGFGSLLLVAGFYGLYLPGADFLRVSPQVARILIDHHVTGDHQVLMIGYAEPSLAFYQGGTIREGGKVGFVRGNLNDFTPWLVVPRTMFDAAPRTCGIGSTSSTTSTDWRTPTAGSGWMFWCCTGEDQAEMTNDQDPEKKIPMTKTQNPIKTQWPISQ